MSLVFAMLRKKNPVGRGNEMLVVVVKVVVVVVGQVVVKVVVVVVVVKVEVEVVVVVRGGFFSHKGIFQCLAAT